MSLSAIVALCLLITKTLAQNNTTSSVPTLPNLDIAKDKEVICKATKTAEAEMKVDISGMMDYDDLLRLTMWSANYLKVGQRDLALPANLQWKRSVVNAMASIFTKSCPNNLVPSKFMHIAKELFMIYQNSMNNSESHEDVWKGFVSLLEECHENTEEFKMGVDGFKAKTILVKTQAGIEEEFPVSSPKEIADQSPDLDLIVDTAWWLFSFSVGACYWTRHNEHAPTSWVARYKRLFYSDFLHDLKMRWLHAGEYTDFGVIFGDFNLRTVIFNMRACVSGAYIKNGIVDRQLVRSVLIAPTKLGVESGLNKKTGAVYLKK